MKRKIMKKNKNTGKLLIVGGVLGGLYMGMHIAARKKNEPESIDEGNPYVKKGAADTNPQTFYEGKVKKILDQVLSFGGLVALSPLYGLLSLAVYLDDPGPVFFSQKRVGKDGHFFMLHKYRSMKMNTPHDIPTHMLENPEQYITRVGRVLRKTSLDELPQVWDIFRGKMSVIGPRPALWNQEDLVEEREKYGANSLMPGLTGLAQIKGRDELEIPDKAKLDGEYRDVLHSGATAAFLQDIRCFAGTVKSVLRSDGVVEGGTGGIQKISPSDAGFEEYGFKKTFHINKEITKRVLITGADSYIGESFRNYAGKHYSNLTIDTIDMRDSSWREQDFAPYNAVFHVAGIAHADVGKVSEEEKRRYYAVNTDLAVKTAEKAKKDGVKQFIFMSSMIIYGDSAPYGKRKVIDENTIPSPANFYGDSKWQADVGVRRLGNEEFAVAVLRPPMIYGRNSKGNYAVLARLAKCMPLFPEVENQRSMLYIDNLCEFLCLLILSGEGGIYFPQNGEYTKTSKMVEEISKASGHNIYMTKTLNLTVISGSKMPGKIGSLVDKAFGNSVYSQKLSIYGGIEYRVVNLRKSIQRIEGETGILPKSVLVVASVASMIDQFSIPSIKLLLELGYDVDVAANFTSGSTCTEEKIEELLGQLDNLNIDCYQVNFDRNIMNIKSDAKAFWQLNDVMKGNAFPVNAVKHHTKNEKNCRKYFFVHSHSPIGGVIGRITAKRNGIRNIYTAHGFHFYNGAPIKNWMIFYPIEKALSRITDVMITINQEDYKRAKKYFHAGKTVYIPGVGVDIRKFRAADANRDKKREELGLTDKDIMLLSVGELNENKNHKIVIRALGDIMKSDPGAFCRLHYFIAGRGILHNELEQMAEELGVDLHLLGFRNDMPELLGAADVFLLPSIREGLNVSLMEAMAGGLPCIVSDIRGNRDLIDDRKGGYLVHPEDVKEWTAALKNLDKLTNSDMGLFNSEKISSFSEEKVLRRLKKYYEEEN